MWKLFLPAVFSTVVLAAQPSSAKSAADLNKTCLSLVGLSQVSCFAYIGGALDMHRQLVDSGKLHREICLPDLKDKDQRKIFVDWTKRQNQPLKGDAVVAIISAFSERYRCSPDEK